MLSWIAAATGGLIKDTTVFAGNAWDVLVDEVSSVPHAFEQGYEHGLFTGVEPSHDEDITEHCVKPEEPTSKFSSRVA